MPESPTNADGFVSVKDAAEMLGVSPWECYELLDEGRIESHYLRLVSVDSLHEYRKGMS